MINDRLTWFLEANNNRLPKQGRPHRSTNDHLVRLETFIREAFIKKEHSTQIQGEHFEDPIPIATYADQDIFVNEATKNKIWNGEYIDLAVLLRQNLCPSATDNSGTLTVVNNQITIKQSGTKIKVPINSIQNWTDAFINFIIIFSLKHKDKATELLNYMAIIRGAAANNPIHKWLAYDTQFRLRMSSDPSKNWANIDGHLWLSCGLSGD